MISFEDFLPQGPDIDTLRKQAAAHQMVHAVLITGMPGSGKRTLARLLAVTLMCMSDTDAPCGKCEGCRLSIAGEHPDVTVIEKGNPLSPDIQKGRATIPVEDIREMIRLCSRFAYEGGNRAVIINDAENMTVQAQNSLLKILEEPPKNTYFLITTSFPEQLLTTVRSRCRNIRLVPWEPDYIQKVLLEKGIDGDTAVKAACASGGSIGKAITLASDDSYWKLREEVLNTFFCNRRRSEVLNISSTWKDRKSCADILFGLLEDSIHQLLKYRLFHREADFPREFPDTWQRFAASASLERFAAVSDAVVRARKQNSSNVNFQAIIEQILLTFIGESDLWAK